MIAKSSLVSGSNFMGLHSRTGRGRGAKRLEGKVGNQTALFSWVVWNGLSFQEWGMSLSTLIRKHYVPATGSDFIWRYKVFPVVSTDSGGSLQLAGFSERWWSCLEITIGGEIPQKNDFLFFNLCKIKNKLWGTRISFIYLTLSLSSLGDTTRY